MRDNRDGIVAGWALGVGIGLFLMDILVSIPEHKALEARVAALEQAAGEGK